MKKVDVAQIFRSILTLISPEMNTRICYRVKFKRSINLDSPTTFNEKILWLKLNEYNGNSLIKKCADKYEVREYIKEKDCQDILNPLLAVYENPEQIEWDRLPDAFVLKWNFGCGLNIVCRDKSKLDIISTIKELKKMKKVNAYLPYSEIQYKNVKKKLLVEQYLCDGSGELPTDYKVYCFNGKADCVMLCIGREKGEPILYYFDRNWNFLRINKAGFSAPEGFTLQKPEGIDEMFAYADKLCEPFAFVRADFYIVNGKVYFGELTFTPCGGLDFGMPNSLDNLFGRKLVLPINKVSEVNV